jgi:RNA polymerase sigma factor (sigma-70 family)
VKTSDPARLSSGRLSSEAAGARLSELFEEHGRMVYGLCRVLLRDADEAEDAAQQAFLSAHRSMLGGTEPRDPAAWLGAIARNECRTRIRARMATPLALVGETAAVAADVEHVAGRHAEIEALCVALAELPREQREAIVLREFYGLSYEEVATALDLTEGAVESLLFRARKRLQAELRPARVASGALALPLALRDSLAAAVPGFSPASSGALAKVASLPLAAKLAAAAATLTAAGTIGYVGIEVRDHEPVSSQRAPAAARSEHPRRTSESIPRLAPEPVAVRENAVASAPRTAGGEERENEAVEDEEQEAETESGEQETEDEVENQVAEPDGEPEDVADDEADDGDGDGDSGQSEREADD